MKKKDLVKIIRKVQNRCCLEAPAKITYYFDDSGDVVFKLHFNSLYVPEKFRVDSEDIQNMFTPTNVYEYEDDFRILELNQDEGWIKVKPDCQQFKVVNTYGESDKISLEQKKEEVHLAGKRLNEDYAETIGYILYESDTELPQNPESLKDQQDAKAPKSTDKPKVNLAVIGVTCPVSVKGFQLFQKAVENIEKVRDLYKQSNENGEKVPMKVAVTIPYIDNQVQPSYAWASIKSFSEEIKKRYGDTYAYVAVSGNSDFAKLINSVELAEVAYLTSTAKQGIKDNNFPQILAAEEVDLGKDVVEDNTLEDAKEIERIILNQIKQVTKDRKTKNTKPQRVKYYNTIKNQTVVKNLLALYKNYFSRSGFDALIDIGKLWDEAVFDVIKGNVDTKALKDLTPLQRKLATAYGAGKKALLTATGNAVGSTFNRSTEKGDNKVSSSMFAGMQYAGGKSVASVGKGVDVDPKKKVKNGTTYMDLEIELLINEAGTDLSKGANLLKALLTDFDFGIDPVDPDDKDIEDQETEKTDEEKDAEDQETTESDEESDDEESDEESDDEESSDEDSDNISESVKGDVYKRLQEIFNV